MTNKSIGTLLLIGTLLACTKKNPIYCETDADCPQGMVCAADTNVCIDVAFDLDRTPYFNDGTRLWATTANPTLRGYIDEPDAVVTVFVNGAPLGTATIEAGTWSMPLPAGTLVDGIETAIRLEAALDDGMQVIEALFAVDALAPTLMLAPTSIIDEAGDSITFDGDAVPNHIHDPSRIITISPDAKASFTKYGYLYDEAPPHYGNENQRNLFALRVYFAAKLELAPDAVQMQVSVNGAGAGWEVLPANQDALGTFIELPVHRGSRPAFSQDGDIKVEWRITDWAQRSTTLTVEWHQTIVAPPVQITTPAISGGVDGIGGWTLLSNPPLSRWINNTAPRQLFERTIRNGTSEALEFDAELPIMSNAAVVLTRREINRNERQEPYDGAFVCDNSIDPRCRTATMPALLVDTPITTDVAAHVNNTVTLTMFGNDGQPLGGCTTINTKKARCTLPGRSPDGAPVTARLVATLAAMPALNPLPSGAPSEIANFTGKRVSTTRCIDPLRSPTSWECNVAHKWDNDTILYAARLELGFHNGIFMYHPSITVTTGQVGGTQRSPSVGLASPPRGLMVWNFGTEPN